MGGQTSEPDSLVLDIGLFAPNADLLFGNTEVSIQASVSLFMPYSSRFWLPLAPQEKIAWLYLDAAADTNVSYGIYGKILPPYSAAVSGKIERNHAIRFHVPEFQGKRFEENREW
jgi:hypothetical protein